MVKSNAGISKKSPSQESSSSLGGSAGLASRISGVSKPDEEELLVNLFDCSAVILHCPRHERFALKKISRSKGMWLPFAQVASTDAWYSSLAIKMKSWLASTSVPKGFLPFSNPLAVHYLRLQMPYTSMYITRVTFYSKLTLESKSAPCCESLNKAKTGLIWFSYEELTNANRMDIWGIEPRFFIEAYVIEDNQRKDWMLPKQAKGTLTENTLHKEARKLLPKNGETKTAQEEMVKASSFGEKEVMALYSDYIQQCYPAVLMIFPSFLDLMRKKGWAQDQEDIMIHIYRAFRYNGHNFMTFQELLLGLAAMDKGVKQGGKFGEFRTGYIFRFYDFDGDGTLSYSELSRFTYDLLKLKDKPHDVKTVEAEAIANYKHLGLKVNDPVRLEIFVRALGTMAIRGSSTLFRSRMNAEAVVRPYYPSTADLDSEMERKGIKPKTKCSRCRAKKYALSSHSVRINEQGIVDKIQEEDQEDIKRASKAKRRLSSENLREDFVANKIMDWVRDHGEVTNVLKPEANRKNSKATSFWSLKQIDEVAREVTTLLQQVEAIFRKEQRVVRVCSPCVVFGDIHGNLHDLLIYERILWRKGPVIDSTNYVFMGDYVDRGSHGVECVLYLFSLKVIAPEKFTLLRGNHELRNIQRTFTFQKECILKFGEHGPVLWEGFNKVFDCMPLCAVIDEAIFCAHGGIPTSATNIEELLKIPLPMDDPEHQSPPAWEILWNDPVNQSEFDQYKQLVDQQQAQSPTPAAPCPPGFLPNAKRGTAYFFSSEAVDRFLKANNLSYILRAHEVIPAGFQFHMKGKVMTIFSSSKYCGGINEAACVLIDQERLRILRLNTELTADS